MTEAAVIGLGEQTSVPVSETHQEDTAMVSLAPLVETSPEPVLVAEAPADEPHAPVVESSSTLSNDVDSGATLQTVTDTGSETSVTLNEPTHEGDTLSAQSLFDGVSDGDFAQPMDMLLAAAAPAQTPELTPTPAPAPAETGEGGHAATGPLLVIQEASAEAAGESFIDQLISQFASADHPASDAVSSQTSDALHTALNSMLAGLDVAQAVIEPISGAHEMEAMAAAHA